MSDVTRQGTRGQRPGREAVPGARGGLERPHRRRRGGEPTVTPKAEFGSYYGRPIIKAPTWTARDIAGYLFLGGLAGGSSLLAAGAEWTGRPVLARSAKLGALGAISLATVALINDLGRPERFANMLRVFKPSSPMSMGSWILAAYGPAAGVAAIADASGLAGRFTPIRLLGRAATGWAALTGPGVACYTAVLIADTAVPAWHEAHRELPFVFCGSAAAAAAGLGLIAAPTGENAPARASALFGAALELAAELWMERRLGEQARPYRTGRAGTLLRAARILTAAGIAGTSLAAGRRRAVAAVAGGALVAGSACLRFGVFEAGRASALDPHYTVASQRPKITA
ncbi:NrfD/PsrC family molybdoenzyme membrane anchor subunit [Actinomadura sp. SCN-SB]|uniref:NrfD/PsrC family molybdoenzyme membrane anchor subunit n=1 Tax=Actinomadura sp. SCN-SB TaxID=3373092 RepID=UPI003753D320